MKKKPYRIVSGASKRSPDSRELAGWLAKDGQLLIPLVELLERGERAIDEVIDVMGRATIEAVLQMSAVQVAGPKEQGRRDADRELYWHGAQTGRVALKERQLHVERPRLRKKRPRADEPGEVEIPGAPGKLTKDSRWKSGGKKGTTNHFHPESCVGRCEAAGEALTGVRTGRAIEHRKSIRLER